MSKSTETINKKNNKQHTYKYTIPSKINNLYEELDISPNNILVEYVMSQIYGKIDKYNSENIFFENKYNSSFEKFKLKVERMSEEEDFQLEDDLNDWEFAFDNKNYWELKLSELKDKND